jgi:Cu(I)/Ag(I) efflux system protein CusF
MNIIRSAGAMALALLLVACGEKQNPARDGGNASGSPTTVAATKVYSGTGEVQSIAGDKVTIAHGPIEDIGWPAMTMTFTAPPGLAEDLQAGRQVDFSFRQDGRTYVLTSLRPR